MGVVTETLRVTGTDAAVRGLKDVGTAADGASKSIQGTSSSMGAMAQQLPDVVTQLAGGANAFQVLTQQGLQVVQSNQAIMASLAPMLPLLGALGAAVAEGYIAYRIFTQEADNAAAVQDVVAAASANLTDWHDMQRDAALDLAQATGELSAAEVQRAKNAISAYAAFLRGTEDLRAKAAELRREQESVTTQLVDMAQGFLDTVDQVGVVSGAFDVLTTGSDELQQQLDGVNSALAREVESAGKTVDAMNKASDAKARAAASSRDHKAALDEEAASLQAIIDMEDKFAAEERRRTEEYQRALGVSPLDAVIAGVDTGVRVTPAPTPTKTAYEIAAEMEAQQAAIDRASNQALLGQSVSAASGGLAQIAAMVNPIVGAIAAAFLNLDNIVQGLKQQLSELPAQLVASPDLLAGLVVAAAEAMPALMEALPDVVSELITALLAPETIAAIAKIAIEGMLLTLGADPRVYIGIVNGLIDAIPQLVQAWIDALKALPQELITGRRELRDRWQGLGERFGGGGLNLQVNGMVGDSWRLGQGIRSLFDRDFGRTGGRF